MCTSSIIPVAAQPILTQIDAALMHLETHRMPHFIAADRKYRPHRKTKYLGFERLISCELYCRLKETLGDIVFLEFPGLAKDRIDLWIDAPHCPVYLELKMFYSDNRKPYEKDFHKLKEMVDAESGSIAVQIHFHFYPNKKQTAQETLRGLSGGLLKSEYWSDVTVLVDPKLKHEHFVRLAFGRA